MPPGNRLALDYGLSAGVFALGYYIRGCCRSGVGRRELRSSSRLRLAAITHMPT